MAPMRSFFAAALAAVFASLALAAPLETSDLATSGTGLSVKGDVATAGTINSADVSVLAITVQQAITTAEAYIKGKQIPGSYTTSEYHSTGSGSGLELAWVVFIRTTATPTKDFKVWVNQNSGSVVGSQQISWPCPGVIC